INDDQLRPVHKLWLDRHVVPLLSVGGSFALIGEASRTGSRSHNYKLSRRRARNTVAYVQGRLMRGFVFVDATSSAQIGAGEIPAALAGQINGTESSYYRAVRVVAWSRPTPPPIPKPKAQPRPQKLYRRVTKRTWESFDTYSVASRIDKHDGGDGVALAGAFKSIYDAKAKGGGDKREYGSYPMDYFPTHVRHESSTMIVRSSLVKTTERKVTIEYIWGPAPRGAPVRLHRKDTTVERWVSGRGTPTIREEVLVLPLEKVWERTPDPNATVWGVPYTW
ncbi:MAG: hypothetical protein HKO98_00800, partial [Gemmatimonadetes bacterium]|nr:hypothetical protein [Gemmatimonadota bacterium]